MVGTGTTWSTEGARHFDPARPRSEHRLTSAVPHQALYRRWRAQTFGEIVGQEAVVETLRNAVRTGRVSHAVLFVGPRGTGKTSLARILAKAVNCTDLRDGDACDACPSCVSIREGTTLDLVEIDAASNRGIDAVRDLRERLPYPPGELKRKVYILDEAHQITKDAWNALLKSLEEPPDFVVFMFASTEPSGLPAGDPVAPPALRRPTPDRSRRSRASSRGSSRPMAAPPSPRRWRSSRALPPAACATPSRCSTSCCRAAPGDIDERRVRDLLGLADAEAVDAFIDALVAGDAATGIALLDSLEERGRDARDLARPGDRRDPRRGSSATSHPAMRTRCPALADAARRLAAIDPDRAGVGGLRLQLELALFTMPRGTATAPRVAIRRRPTRHAGPATQPVTPPVASRRATPEPPSEPATGAAAAVASIPEPPPAATPPVATAPAAPATEPGPPEPVPADAEVAATAETPAPAADAPATEPPPADPTAAAAGTATPSDLGPDLARLRDGWPTIVASVQPAVRAVINECRPMGVEGNVVTLGFPESKGFLKDHAERRRPELEDAIGAFLGRDVSVRSVATNLELVPPAADDLVAEARRIFADDLADVGEVR